ncbi:MAG: 4-hydroxy-tetrahydrodipicolinate reductase [Ignavibacteriaceae bacterium]
MTSRKIKYGIIGVSGRLGSEVKNVFNEAGHKLVFQYDIDGEQIIENPEILIDCSLPDVFGKTIGYQSSFHTPLIVATTGLSEQQLSQLKSLSIKYPVVQSYNYSIGIQVLLKLSAIAYDKLKDWDIEITETHHRFKKDKPSGTAKMIQDIVKEKNVNISSLRLGNVAGDHTISFGGLGEVLSITHSATSRRTFAEGILKSAEFVIEKENGFYSFTDVVFGK